MSSEPPPKKERPKPIKRVSTLPPLRAGETEGLNLVVFISAADYDRLCEGQRYSSRTENVVVTNVLQQLGLPNPQPYTSIAACVGRIPSWSALRGYGAVLGFLKAERVLARIAIAAPDDLQDVCYGSSPGLIQKVEGDDATRTALLKDLATTALGRKRYAEARIDGDVGQEDFIAFDTSGSTEINLRGALAKVDASEPSSSESPAPEGPTSDPPPSA